MHNFLDYQSDAVFLCSVWTGSLLLGLQVKDLCTMAFHQSMKQCPESKRLPPSSAVDLAELIIIPSHSDGVMSLEWNENGNCDKIQFLLWRFFGLIETPVQHVSPEMDWRSYLNAGAEAGWCVWSQCTLKARKLPQIDRCRAVSHLGRFGPSLVVQKSHFVKFLDI